MGMSSSARHSGGLAILDYGSQTTQLIARRLRDQGVYAEIFPWDTDEARVMAIAPRGFILSGSPASVYEADAPRLPDYVLPSRLPVLGICYGMQLLAHALGGRVAGAGQREYGHADVSLGAQPSPLFGSLPAAMPVWMSHGDRVETPPPGWRALASTPHAPFAAMGDEAARRYGVQFHPEVTHTPAGPALLRNFALEI